METVVQTPVQNDPDLHFLTQWGSLQDRTRQRSASVLSILLHVVGITGLALLPQTVISPQRGVRQITPLIAPLRELTQTAPNKGKISKEFNMEALLPRPRIQIPPSPPSTTRPAAVTPALPEPPKVEAARTSVEAPQAALAQPLPQIQAEEKPKLAFEIPSPPAPVKGAGGKIAVPSTSVDEAIRSMVRRGPSGGLMVGDLGEPGIGGIGEGLNLPPSPGKAGSSLELLSDPLGVDFRPYLIKILASVRRNWFAVMPESAMMGRRGRVGIQFAISRNGSVPKLVIVAQSGTDALDRAAVAGISASNPFPPLPTEYKGDQIRLQFNFAYNIPKN